MNIQELNILKYIKNKMFVNQKDVAIGTGHSIGVVNRSLKNLIKDGYLDKSYRLTSLASSLFISNRPKNAIILAAGFGIRMVPINNQVPKSLLKVKGEVLIERMIHQLHEVGVEDIYVVVGFMKEQFEYLIDDFGVHLVVNSEYATKNNLHSLNLVSDKLSNSYIVLGDLWCESNPFSCDELYSWYMVSDLIDDDSEVRVNRKGELVRTDLGGNTMVGISYLLDAESEIVRSKIAEKDLNHKYDSSFWECVLYDKDKMIVPAKIVSSKSVMDINTFEQLRDLDESSENLKSDALDTISVALNVDTSDIENIQVLKKGMTNRSFMFSCHDKKYIMRIPGEGTNKMINRKEEASVYSAIKDKNICDDIIYINPENGYKITRFLENSRVCDSNAISDLKDCMKVLRDFHSLRLTVNHSFDLFEKIEFYESLWKGTPSVYRDYKKTKDNIYKLKSFIDSFKVDFCLTHIDAVPDNFLINEEGIRLIDWEYAAMQDPDVDIAMFCIYALYDREQIDQLIDIYFENKCSHEVRMKIYAYIAICGLLWSNWCEYKQQLGIEFGEYSMKQYRYAKDYFKIVESEGFLNV